MPVNPLGAVQVNDFGNPVVITAIAREIISGGQFVFASGASNVVSSGASSLLANEIVVATGASGASFTGIALATAGSNTYVPVAMRGIFIVPSRTAVSGGLKVAAAGDDTVGYTLTASHIAGTALTESTSGNFVVVALQSF